jgi:hypothetical protein
MRGSVPYYIKIRLKKNENISSGLVRLSHLAPLYLMCDPMDIRVVPQLEGGAR